MPVTITLPDPLASRLQSEARQQQLTVDELVADVLSRALDGPDDAAWQKLNQRRLSLVHKSATVGLTPQEASELQHLQTLADQRLDALDRQRLAEVKRIEREVDALLQETGPS